MSITHNHHHELFFRVKCIYVFIQCDVSSVCSTVQKLPEAQEDEDDEDHDANTPVDCWTDSMHTHTHTQLHT